eukprot:gene2490-5418_t
MSNSPMSIHPAIHDLRTYAIEPENPSKCSKARGSDLRVHYKNTRETAMAIRGKTLTAGKQHLEAVLERKRCIPFRRHVTHCGRTGQAQRYPMRQHRTVENADLALRDIQVVLAKQEDMPNGTGRWPVKSVEFILNLLKNAESNAEVKGLDVDNLVISQIQVNRDHEGAAAAAAYLAGATDDKPRKLSKKSLAIKLRSGSKSA